MFFVPMGPAWLGQRQTLESELEKLHAARVLAIFPGWGGHKRQEPKTDHRARARLACKKAT